MRLTLTLALLAGGNVLLNLLTQWYVVTRSGVGVATDALFAGAALPQLVLAIVGGSLTLVLVPLLVTEADASFRRHAWFFFVAVTSAFALLAVLLYAGAEVWVPLLVPGFDADARALTIELTRIQLVGMVFSAATAVLWSVYHARRKFIWVELSALLSTLISLALLMWALPRYGVTAAAGCAVLRTGLQAAALMPGLNLGKRPPPLFPVTPLVAESWRRVKPLLFGTAYYRTDPLVDRFLASMAPAGGLSLLHIGQQLYGAANFVVDKAVAAPLTPSLAASADAGDWRGFARSYHKRLLFTGGSTIVGYAVLLISGAELLRLLIGHGGVTAENVRELWRLMVALGGVFVCGAMGAITARAFYAMSDTRTPTRLTVVTYTVYVPTKIAAFYYYGLPGLALTTTAYFAVNLGLQIALLARIFRTRIQKVDVAK